jgi:hypothetical protein
MCAAKAAEEPKWGCTAVTFDVKLETVEGKNGNYKLMSLKRADAFELMRQALLECSGEGKVGYFINMVQEQINGDKLKTLQDMIYSWTLEKIDIEREIMNVPNEFDLKDLVATHPDHRFNGPGAEDDGSDATHRILVAAILAALVIGSGGAPGALFLAGAIGPYLAYESIISTQYARDKRQQKWEENAMAIRDKIQWKPERLESLFKWIQEFLQLAIKNQFKVEVESKVVYTDGPSIEDEKHVERIKKEMQKNARAFSGVNAAGRDN